MESFSLSSLNPIESLDSLDPLDPLDSLNSLESGQSLESVGLDFLNLLEKCLRHCEVFSNFASQSAYK